MDMRAESRTTPAQLDHRQGGQGVLARMAAGQEEALDELMGQHWDGLHRYALRLLGNSDAAADVAQLAFVRLWEQRAGHVSEGAVAAYLYRTARNLVIDEQRRRKVRREWAQGRKHVSGATWVTPLDDVQAVELHDRISAALRALPPRRREVLELARFHDLSYREIGEVMGISPQTVANQMSAALAQLRAELEPYLEPMGMAASAIPA